MEMEKQEKERIRGGKEKREGVKRAPTVVQRRLEARNKTVKDGPMRTIKIGGKGPGGIFLPASILDEK